MNEQVRRGSNKNKLVSKLEVVSVIYLRPDDVYTIKCLFILWF